jgi:hypothetical protein
LQTEIEIQLGCHVKQDELLRPDRMSDSLWKNVKDDLVDLQVFIAALSKNQKLPEVLSIVRIGTGIP